MPKTCISIASKSARYLEKQATNIRSHNFPNVLSLQTSLIVEMTLTMFLHFCIIKRYSAPSWGRHHSTLKVATDRGDLTLCLYKEEGMVWMVFCYELLNDERIRS